MQQALQRFLKYSFVGGVTFSFDLALLFILTDFLVWHYLVATASSFLVAISVNYILSRKYVFIGTKKTQVGGYFWFLIIALSGMAIVVGMMYVLVAKLQVYYILARIIVALFTGLWNYLLNLYLNFRVVGIYPESP